MILPAIRGSQGCMMRFWSSDDLQQGCSVTAGNAGNVRWKMIRPCKLKGQRKDEFLGVQSAIHWENHWDNNFAEGHDLWQVTQSLKLPRAIGDCELKALVWNLPSVQAGC